MEEFNSKFFIIHLITISEKLVSMEEVRNQIQFLFFQLRFQKNQLVWRFVFHFLSPHIIVLFQKNQLVWRYPKTASRNSADTNNFRKTSQYGGSFFGSCFFFVAALFQKNQLVWRCRYANLKRIFTGIISEKLVSMEGNKLCQP